VDEWENEWLADVRTDEDVEKRLEGMVEEIAWGSVMWFPWSHVQRGLLYVRAVSAVFKSLWC
jgi:hypothetical protein